MKPRVLLLASKHPGQVRDLDGGGVLVRQLASALPARAAVDAIWLCERDTTSRENEAITTIDYIPAAPSTGCRFESRIASHARVAARLASVADRYDRIVITHVSNAFGLERQLAGIRARTVLFPMFTAASYRRAGETVPDAYRDLEASALRCCGRIISPSEAEATQLVIEYGVRRSVIACVPRGIDLETFHVAGRAPPPAVLDVLCIGTIKPQKNQHALPSLVAALARLGVPSRIHIVGGIGDPEYRRDLARGIRAAGLESAFVFHGVCAPASVAAIAARCHVAVSLAAWETFGRGIYEGLATALPTFVSDHLDCVWEHLVPGRGIWPVAGPGAAAEAIARLIAAPPAYIEQTVLAAGSVRHLAQRVLVERMVTAILDDGARATTAA